MRVTGREREREREKGTDLFRGRVVSFCGFPLDTEHGHPTALHRELLLFVRENRLDNLRDSFIRL